MEESTILNKLDSIVEAQGLTVETEAIVLGAIMTKEGWRELVASVTGTGDRLV